MEKDKRYNSSPLIQEEEDFFDLIENENTNKIKEILKNDKKIWTYRNKENEDSTVLHLAVFKRLYEISELIIEYVKDKNEEGLENFLNETNKQGVAAIHYASFRGNIKIIKLLVENGANIYLKTQRQLNIIHYACQGNRPNSLMYFYLQFLENNKEGFDLIKEQDSGGSTPLHWAAYSNAEDVLLYLINLDIFENEEERKNFIDKKDKQGYTALHLSITSKSVRIVMKLLQNGASTDIRDNKGNTPLELARNKKQREIAEIIRNNQNCQICNVKAPVKQIKKSSKNIILVFLFQILTTFILFTSVISMAFDSEKGKTLYKVSFIIYMVFLILFFLLYIILLLKNPGIIKSRPLDALKKILDDNKDLLKYCYKCFVKKNKYSKHCIICNKCYDNFDHHCYWINKCVAGKNYILFLAFLFETFFYLAIVLVICIFGISHYIRDNADDKVFCFHFYNDIKLESDLMFKKKNTIHLILNILMMIIVLSFLIPEFLLLILHIQVYCSNYKLAKSRKNSTRTREPTLIETSILSDTSLESEIE